MAAARSTATSTGTAAPRRTSVDAEALAAAAKPAPPPPNNAPPPNPPNIPLPPFVPFLDDSGPWVAVVATCAALVAYGLLQERVMSRDFGGERFAYAVALVAANRLVCVAAVLALHLLRAARAAFALAASSSSRPQGASPSLRHPRPHPASSSSSMLRRASSAGGAAAASAPSRRFFYAWATFLVPLLRPPPPAAPLRCYARVSLSNALAALCQYEALRHVSFIAASLAKTAKALPVLLWGVVLARRRRHTSREAAVAVALAVGCALFALGGHAANSSSLHPPPVNGDQQQQVKWWWRWASQAAGPLLLASYLAADGWTSTEQERLYARYGGGGNGDLVIIMDEGDQLLYTSLCSALISFAAALFTGQLLPAAAFLQRHGDALLAVLGLSAASAATQLLIGAVVRRHGALVFAQLMTGRQLASVLLSAAVFGHALATLQWLGVSVAFGALLLSRAGGGLVGGGGGKSEGGGGGASKQHQGEQQKQPHEQQQKHQQQQAPELVGVVVVGSTSCGGGEEERAPLLAVLPVTVRAS